GHQDSAGRGRTGRRPRRARTAVAPDPGPPRRLDDVVRRLSQADARSVHRHALLSPGRALRLPARLGLGGAPAGADRGLRRAL
ncbi:MAG: hypothetical protein AVDCRST_MAG45-1624, partial [uncultured Solirubrobacterales bacterium]